MQAPGTVRATEAARPQAPGSVPAKRDSRPATAPPAPKAWARLENATSRPATCPAVPTENVPHRTPALATPAGARAAARSPCWRRRRRRRRPRCVTSPCAPKDAAVPTAGVPHRTPAPARPAGAAPTAPLPSVARPAAGRTAPAPRPTNAPVKKAGAASVATRLSVPPRRAGRKDLVRREFNPASVQPAPTLNTHCLCTLILTHPSSSSYTGPTPAPATRATAAPTARSPSARAAAVRGPARALGRARVPPVGKATTVIKRFAKKSTARCAPVMEIASTLVCAAARQGGRAIRARRPSVAR